MQKELTIYKAEAIKSKEERILGSQGTIIHSILESLDQTLSHLVQSHPEFQTNVNEIKKQADLLLIALNELTQKKRETSFEPSTQNR